MLKIIHSESQNTAVQVIRNSGCHVQELMDRDIFCILILGNIFIECIIQT